MFKSFSMELAGRTLTVEIGKVCAQANGAAFMYRYRIGETERGNRLFPAQRGI